MQDLPIYAIEFLAIRIPTLQIAIRNVVIRNSLLALFNDISLIISSSVDKPKEVCQPTLSADISNIVVKDNFTATLWIRFSFNFYIFKFQASG